MAVPLRSQADESPFVRAGRAWDDRYARQARTVRNWQLVALVGLAMAAGFALALVQLASQSRVTPYVVEVDRHGGAVAFGPAEALGVADERIIRFLLAEYVHNVRTIVSDDAAQRHLIERAYAYSQAEATLFLNYYYRRANPFDEALRSTRRVEVTSILPVAEATWQVQWTETTLRALRPVAPPVAWQAVLVVDQDPPTSTERLLSNPLGLFVVEITWQQMSQGDPP